VRYLTTIAAFKQKPMLKLIINICLLVAVERVYGASASSPLANCSGMFIADGSGFPYAFKYILASSFTTKLGFNELNNFCRNNIHASSQLAILRNKASTEVL
jgi:hypothetical protein